MGRLSGGLIAITLCLLPYIAHASPVSMRLAMLGEQALEAEDYPKARKLCEQAIVADPANASGFACLGRSFAKSGHGKAAEHYYETALSLSPTHIKALVWSALRDLSIGRPDKARKKLDRLEKHCGKCEAAQKLRADYLRYKARKNAAKRSR